MIVEPKDLAGTWKEYLALYADVVERKADERSQEAAEKAALASIKDHLADAHGVDSNDVTLHYGYRNGQVDATLRVHLPVARSRAKNPPGPYVLAAKALGLDVDGGAS